MLAQIKEFVAFETPTTSKPHIDQLGDRIARLCDDLGADVRVFSRRGAGDVRLAIWNGNQPGKPIMLLGHIDTVWPLGTLEQMPLREADGRLYGPGALDMKAGMVVALEAIRGLLARGEFPRRPIWLFLNTDEETGSVHTRDLIREKAASCGLVLVLEPGTPEGALKTWRKGFGRYAVTVKGRASHSGSAPEAGINAVIEAAHQAIDLHDLNDLRSGTSVSVNLIAGGIAINVIPAHAELQLDTRFLTLAEAERVDAAIQGLMPVLPGAEVTVTGGIDRGPMEHDDQMVRTFAQAREIAASIGLELHEDGSGGGSDGNFTAAMGIPTLDGLGGYGDGLHAANEHVVIGSLARRAALLARLLMAWEFAAG